MKKLFLALFAVAFAFVLVGCGNDDAPTTGTNETQPPAGNETAGGNETTDAGSGLSAEVEALMSQWRLPAPRFTPDVNTPSWQLDREHFVEITWYVNESWFSPRQLGDTTTTQVVREDLGIIINWISGDDTTLNAMMAAGDLPDIVTMHNEAALTFQADEWAIPLDVLSAVYDPYFMANVVPPIIASWHSIHDGHFYGMPNDAWSREAIEDGTAWPRTGLMVREDIFDAIGRPDMTTPDGFLQALRDARDYMPYADHGVPMVPFAGQALDIVAGGNGAFWEALQDFLAIPFVDENGDWYDREAHEEYLEWLLVFRQALEEGLMNNDQFSDPHAMVQERLSLGTFFAYMTPSVFDVGSSLELNNSRGTNQYYIPVSGPRNRAGDDHRHHAGGLNGWTQTFVTQQTIDPQTAMQVITYFSSDHGNEILFFGVEGEHFDRIDGLNVVRPEIWENNEEHGVGHLWLLRNLNFLNRNGNLPGISINDHVAFSQQFNEARLEMQGIYPNDGGTLQRNLGYMNTARTQAIVNVIQAPDDATATQIWADFLESRNEFMFQELTDFRNERIRENRGRIGDQ